MALDEGERRQACKALWGWSLMDQPSFASSAGITHSRLRTMLDDGKGSPPSTDELFALARAAGVPESFAVEGFRPWSLQDRVAALERATEQLEDSLTHANVGIARCTREIAELRDARRGGGRGGDSGR